jgi:outer membrane receptor protein involved in Fe transport
MVQIKKVLGLFELGKLGLPILAFAVVAGITTGAYAQGTAPLDELTVRARATEQSIRDIPVAITAVSEEILDRYGLKDLRDIASFTPGMEMVRTSSGAGVQISVRGISSSAQTIGIESSVALISDGVYFSQSRVVFEGLIDTKQVAILKGPQALYFGKNATAGVISLTSNDPGDELEILGKIGYEIEAQEWAAEAVLSTPINDKVGIRLALAYSDMNQGYINNIAGATTYTTYDQGNGGAATVHANGAPKSRFSPGEEFMYTRLTLKGTPTDNLTWRIKGSFADATVNNNTVAERMDCSAIPGFPHMTSPAPSAPPNQFPINMEAPGNECLADRASGQNPIPPTLAASDPDLGRFGGELGESYKSYIVTGDLEWDTDKVNVTAIANWHQQRIGWVIDADGGGDTAVMAAEFSTFDAFSIETRASTKFEGRLNGVVGFYYQDTKRDWRQDVIFAGSEDSSVADPMDRFVSYNKVSETDGQTVSIYAELIYDINDQFELTAGLRYIDEKKDSYFTQPYVNPFFKGMTGPGFTFGPNDGPAPLFVEGRMLTDDRSFDDFIPEVTLRWQPNDETTVWVAYKQGFKSGGFDNGSTAPSITPPQRTLFMTLKPWRVVRLASSCCLPTAHSVSSLTCTITSTRTCS